MKENTYKKNEKLILDTIDDMNVLYDTENNVIHLLNETSLFIYELANGTTLQYIINKFLEEYDVQIHEIQEDVTNTLDEMVKENILFKN